MAVDSKSPDFGRQGQTESREQEPVPTFLAFII